MATVILRPNAPGDLCQLGWQTGDACPNHYLNVDEVTPDGNTTVVKPSGGQQSQTISDLYNLENLPGGAMAITNVRVYQLTRKNHTSVSARSRNLIKTGGVIYEGSNITPSSTSAFNAYTTDWAINPQTGVAWTEADINALQVGIKSIGLNPTPSNYIVCTQIYVEVTFAGYPPIVESNPATEIK